jgi:hypothetical protein
VYLVLQDDFSTFGNPTYVLYHGAVTCRETESSGEEGDPTTSDDDVITSSR